MNILLTIGFLLLIGYTAGWLAGKIGLPKIIGYLLTGITFSPNTAALIDTDIIQSTNPLLELCLVFIACEVGGSLKWSKIKKHEKEIISITLLASLFPYILITAGIVFIGLLFPEILLLDPVELLFCL